MEGLGTVYDRVVSEQPNKKRLLFIPVSVIFFFPNSVPVSVFVPIYHVFQLPDVIMIMYAVLVSREKTIHICAKNVEQTFKEIYTYSYYINH